MKKKNIFTNTTFCVIIGIAAIIFLMICAEIGLTKSGWQSEVKNMKYKQGEKMIVEIAEVKENSYVLNKIGEVKPMEAKIRRQAAEITRLLAENERLKTNYENIRAVGQNEAWELARKLENLDLASLFEIFKECNC